MMFGDILIWLRKTLSDSIYEEFIGVEFKEKDV